MHQTPIKTIFVCEFITAGGFNHSELPPSLVREGVLMRDALLRDLSTLPYEVLTTYDARLAAPTLVANVVSVGADDNAWQIFQTQMQNADAVWLIAPETDGLLAKLVKMAETLQKTLIGCGLQSIEITASKLATCTALQQAGIATISTYTLDNMPSGMGVWLVKPDDGAGCDATFLVDNLEEVSHLKTQQKVVIQPFQAGVHASISCVMANGKAYVLSCNTQLIEIKQKQLYFKGCIVNGMRMYWEQFVQVANQIAQALPDLAGYVGIDVIVNGAQVVVVEINPRLTTSYGALADAIGANPAQLILQALTQPDFAWPVLQQNCVEIHV